jgi:HEXXH motif-containing protein
MDVLDFRPFSHPGFRPETRRPLLTQLLIRDAQLRARSFVRRSGAEVGARSSGLVETLAAWGAAAATLSEAKGFPLAFRVYRDPKLDLVWVAAMSAAHLHAAGHEGEWRATFASPAPLLWGSLMTPPLRGLSVSARKDEARLHMVREDGGESSLTLPASAPPAPAEGWSELSVADLGARGRKLVIFDAATHHVSPLKDSYEYTVEQTSGVAKTLEQAGLLLEAYAPAYLDWAADAAYGLVPIKQPGEDTVKSVSFADLFGIPYISFPIPPIKLAEALVHEPSHQYFHYVQIDTLLTNGRDKALYPSPYVNKDRPIDRILVAFHAFANITLFYRACLTGGLPEGREKAEREIAFHLPILTQFSEALGRTPGLTEAGRALFEPLRERLFG